MAKAKRKVAKRGTTADRDGLRARKSGVSKAGKPALRKPKPAKTDLGKQKSSLRSETARLKRQLKAARMQQEASAVLRAVANASGNAAGPLQLIAETTARLFEASSVSIQLAEGSEFTQEYRVGAIAKLRTGRFAMEFAQSASIALQRITNAGEEFLILILSDINMPGMSGLELLPNTKAIRPDVPIIMITAYGDAETKRRALENGAEALLTKPIDFGTLRLEVDSPVERAA
jgi:CheY-like chemotaxis protein